jgi:hypothetical protein
MVAFNPKSVTFEPALGRTVFSATWVPGHSVKIA